MSEGGRNVIYILPGKGNFAIFETRRRRARFRALVQGKEISFAFGKEFFRKNQKNFSQNFNVYCVVKLGRGGSTSKKGANSLVIFSFPSPLCPFPFFCSPDRPIMDF